MKKVLDHLEKLVTWGCIASFSVMAIMGVLQVTFRYGLDRPLEFSEELARYTFIWSVFLGSVICYRRGSHAAIEIFVKMLPDKVRRVVLLLATITCSAFFALIVVQGWDITVDAMGQASASLGVSMAYAYAVLPVGGLLLLIYSLEILWNIIWPPGSAA
jgi:TRAP-type C4-dicarboxylate transport system permease small subunit